MGDRLEVHEHAGLTTPVQVLHAHDGGNTGHQHTEHGPAMYTIDRDAWYAATGLRGGGRKTFTAARSGPQMPLVDLEPWQRTYTLIWADGSTTTRSTADLSGEAV